MVRYAQNTFRNCIMEYEVAQSTLSKIRYFVRGNNFEKFRRYLVYLRQLRIHTIHNTLRGPGGGGGGLYQDFLEIDFLVVSDREE